MNAAEARRTRAGGAKTSRQFRIRPRACSVAEIGVAGDRWPAGDDRQRMRVAGIGWADDGPRAGLLPVLRRPALLAIASADHGMVSRGWRNARQGTVRRAGAAGAGVRGVVPTVRVRGADLRASASTSPRLLLIGYFMRRHGKLRLGADRLASSLGVPIIVLPGVRKVVPGAAAQRPDRERPRVLLKARETASPTWKKSPT